MDSTRSGPPLGPDDWPADGALFGNRPPIRSHRRPRDGRRRRPLRVLVSGAMVGTMAWSATGWTTDVPHHRDGLATMQDPPARDLAVGAPPTAPHPAGGGAPATAPPGAPRPIGDASSAGSTPPPVATPSRPPLRPVAATAGITVAPAPPRGRSDARPAAPAPTPTTRRPDPPAATRTSTPAPTTAPATPTAVAPSNGGTVRLMNPTSGQFVGVRDGSTADGAGIVQLTGSGDAARWKLVGTSGGCYQLINLRSGKALDNPDGGYDDGAPMQQWEPASGNPNQNWCFRSVGSKRYSIRNVASGSLLDLRDGRTGGGVPIQQWSADPAAPKSKQTWQLVRVD
ncbi:RICIN domain-containing protein [Micromonospora sp. DT227]|uniref:RICIN domain-containing protein n=1 Tax=Micromonospora sp. DT227 TaxID=3393433 RepID=UPI003CE8CC04